MLYYSLALALGVAAVVVAGWRLRPRRSSLRELPGFRRLTALGGDNERSTPGELGFVGRQAELDTLFETARKLQQGPALVLVSGPPGSGKRSLLEEFKRRAPTSASHVRTGPLINLAPRRELDEVLSEIVTAFEYQNTARFDQFRRNLDKYRAKRAGHETATERRLARAAEVVKAVVQAAPLGSLAGSVAEPMLQEGRELLAGRLVGLGDLQSVVRAFAEDLRGASRPWPDAIPASQPRAASPIVPVLMLENFDARPGDEDVRLLLAELLPNLRPAPVLILATIRATEAEALQWLGPMPEHPVSVTLGQFTEAETREFAEQQLGVTRADLAQQIWRATEGSPQRLAILHGYYRQNPEERTRPKLSEAAERLVATGEATDLVSSVESESQQDLLRALSALRVVNAELLQEVAAALDIKPASGEPPPVAVLTRPGRGPRWFSRGSRGWSFDRPAWRESILQEFRDANPDRYRKTHLVAARYHRRGLARRESTDASPPLPAGEMDWLLTYRSAIPASRRFADDDYVSHLAEWLYHTIAIEPERGFELLQDQIAEALFAAARQVVSELTRLGREAPITPPQRARLRRLEELAGHFSEQQFDQAAAALRQLDQLGGATPLLRGLEAWYLGICQSKRERPAEAFVCFDLARARFDGLEAAGTREILMSCYNATWQAASVSTLERTSENAVKILQNKIDALPKTHTDPRTAGILKAIHAELLRARAIIEQEWGADQAAAEKSYQEALKVLDEADEPQDRAGVHMALGGFYARNRRHEEADKQLEEAEAAYRLLGLNDEVAQVRIERLGLHLDQDRLVEAGHDLEAIPLQAESPAINAEIGRVYSDAERWSEAAAAFERAEKLQPDNPAYSQSLANSLARLDKWDGALEALARAAKATPEPIDVEDWLDKGVPQDEPPERVAVITATAAQNFPDRPRVRLIHALARWRLGEREAAEEQFRALRDGLPDGTTVEEYAHRYALDSLDQDERITLLRFLVGVFDARPALHFLLFEQLWQAAAPVVAGNDLVESPLREHRWASGEGASSTASPASAGEPVEPAPVSFAELERYRLRAWPESGDAEAFGTAPGQPGPRDTRERQVLRHEARQHLESACRLAHGELEWRLRLTEVLIEMKDWEKADEQAAAVLAEWPGNERARQLQNRARFRRSWDRVGVWDPALPIVVEVAESLEYWVGETQLGRELIRRMLPALRRELRTRLGFRIPGVRVRVNVGLPPGLFVILLHEVPRFIGSMDGDYLTDRPPGDLPAGVAGRAATLTWDPARAGSWLSAVEATSARLAGLRLWDPRGVILSCLGRVLEQHAAEVLGVEDVGMLVDDPAIPSGLSVDHLRLTAVLRALLRERVPIADLPTIIDVLAAADADVALVDVVERVRERLAPRFLEPLLDRDGKLPALDLPPDGPARVLLGAGRVNTRGHWHYLTLSDDAAEAFRSEIREALIRRDARAFVVGAPGLRPDVRAVTESEFADLAIISANELDGTVLA